MAIQFRRGAFIDFIKSKMVAGEPAVVQSGDTSTQSGKAFYICYTPGSVDRVLTEQDKTALDSQISDIEDDLAAAEQAIENVRQSIPAVDATLTTTGAAADAKKTGDEIADLKSDLEQITPGLSDNAKEALLDCFAHVAWTDEHGQDYYDALDAALSEGNVYITAKFTQGDDVFFTDDSLDELKSNLVVTLHDNGQKTVIPAAQYTLTGTLVAGQNTITANYQGYTSTFNVTAIINLAGALTNLKHPTSAASGTYTYSDGVYNVKCASQAAIDNWWSWAYNANTVWNDVVGETLAYRIKIKRSETAHEDSHIDWDAAVFKQENIASMSTDNRNTHFFKRIFPTTEYVKHTGRIVAEFGNFESGNMTGTDTNTRVGHLFYIRTLDMVQISEVKMGVI